MIAHPIIVFNVKLRGLRSQIEELQKRIEFKSSLEKSFDSLQVGGFDLS